MSIELHFNNHQAVVSPGSPLHEYGEKLGIQVPTSCNRQGKCKECLVEVLEGNELLSEPVNEEAHLFNKNGNQDTVFRLSCRTRIIADTGIIKCNTMRRGNMRIENKAFKLPTENKSFKLNPTVTKQGDAVLIDGIEVDLNEGPIYGIAMDLGTTTIVLRLINLETGEITADTSFENPQRFGGSDIMSRIHYDTSHSGKLLQRTLAGYLTHAIMEFPVDPKSIYEIVVAGNSTMRDLFFRLNVYTIGQNPYRSITELEMEESKRKSTSVFASPKRLLLPINPKGRVYGLPVISGHVGADAAACLLAVNMMNSDELIAVMDIGTNTELLLGNKNKIYAASCPAGPAFEGGNIVCGMPGLTGAVEKIKLNNDGSFALGVIDNTIPEGICGSGLIDLLSELIKHEKMNFLGRLTDDAGKVVLYPGKDYELYITEKDINELAQAKGANAAGLQVLFNNYGVRFEDVNTFYLAGGFGTYLNVDAAKTIGLIPDINSDKFIQAGNASIEGACVALLSSDKRNELENAVRNIVHCRLETHPSFFDYFVEGCQFNPITSNDSGTSELKKNYAV